MKTCQVHSWANLLGVSSYFFKGLRLMCQCGVKGTSTS
jgi:hypothetical protein